jgi:uncharacterized secreted protein with C-terminal beta-propeller domain
MRSVYRSLPLLSIAGLLGLGCNSNSNNGGPVSDPDSGYFESSSQGSVRDYEEGGVATGDGSAAPNAPGPGAPADDGGKDAAREIAEADIIQMQGTSLFAMSRTGGLSVIDISNPSSLKILGRYRTSFTPFEMYVKDGIVFAMYSDWGQFVETEADDGTQTYVWQQTSELLALDATDPAHISKISQYELPGDISDSRLVGDVLYAVSYQNGSCWNCTATPSTNVVSINIADPASPAKIDELSFEDESPEYSWGKRSISVTTERIYIAGPEYGYREPENSTIQVVDISDPTGVLEAGTSLRVRGEINNRWQMDEYEGTLRVISQPWTWWNNSVPPSVETFTVTSSHEITELAHLPIVIPERELLRSVRFDGPRGYAVTAVQQDPLFTFDLSDPANPKQMGELVMPGFLHHMEPRGDRLLALGFDQGNPEGALTVSLFDVSDLAKPTMIERVNFGGSWGSFPEDQDRIHKAFKIDPTNGLILVPFQGWQPTDKTEGWCGQSLNGVQLVDYANDDLGLRGMTTSLGQARRAFMAGDALFTVADQEVAAYDISNRDEPKSLSGAPLALNVSLTLPTGDSLVRLRQDWYSSDMRLEVVPKAAPDAMVASTTFNLTNYLRAEHGLTDCGYWHPSNEPLFTVGDTVWTLINDYGNWYAEGGYVKGRALLVGFSPETGAVTGSLELPFQPGYWGWGNTSRIVRGDVAILLQEGWDEQGSKRSLAALDLSDPTAPKLAYTTPLPSDDYYGSTGLLESGNDLVTSYARTVKGKDGVVRHYLMRIDITDPLQPKLLGTFNVPGYLIDYDAAKQTAVTLDHQPVVVQGKSWEECQQKLPTGWFDSEANACRGYSATLYRVSVTTDSVKVQGTLRNDRLLWSTPRRGDGRLFFAGGGYYGGPGYAGDIAVGPGYYYGGWSWASQSITVVDSDTFAHSVVEAPGVWNTVPNGTSLVLAPSAGQPLTVIDGSDAEHPVLRSGEDTALGYTNHLSISGQDVYLSQGDGGVQHMLLP